MKIWLLALLGTLALTGLFGWLFWRRTAQAAAIAQLQAPPPSTVAVAIMRLRWPSLQALISQRVRAGMARAKAQGKHVARPPLAQVKQVAIAQLLRNGLSMNQVSKQLNVAYGTVNNYAQKLKSA